MCSFLIANWLITANITLWNSYMQLRGPDITRRQSLGEWDLVHNLLSIVGVPGSRLEQPFISEATGTAAVYNGEIYNHAQLRRFSGTPDYGSSDGEVLLPAYEDHGVIFPRVLEGELALALVDTRRSIAVLATDAFGTKPLWYAASATQPRFAAASYRSALVGLDEFEPGEIRRVPPNTVLIFEVAAHAAPTLLRQMAFFEFDLAQFKAETDDWEEAFQQAVDKRSRQLRHAAWLGMSSGHDSGAIHCALEAGSTSSEDEMQSPSYAAWYLRAGEWLDVLHGRLKYRGASNAPGLSYLVQLGEDDYEEHKAFLSAHAEPTVPEVAEDSAAIGLSYMAAVARQMRQLVYLSGTGADETLSDYGYLGVQVDHMLKELPTVVHSRRVSQPFPSNLSDIFPWNNFFVGSMKTFLAKEEVVMGAHGIEARYPFLSPRVVQEYLWLTPEAKNRAYKAPLQTYLRRHGYPFRHGAKLGFGAGQNLRQGHSLINLVVKPHLAPSVWEELLDEGSQHCLGAYFAPNILRNLDQFAVDLADPCKFLENDGSQDTLRMVLSWANIAATTEFHNISSECSANDVALRLAAAVLLGPGESEYLAAQERAGAPVFLEAEISWLLDLDWVTALSTRRLRPAIALAARVAAVYGSEIQSVSADSCPTGDMSAAMDELRARWRHEKTRGADKEGQSKTRLPLSLNFLATNAALWRIAYPDSCSTRTIGSGMTGQCGLPEECRFSGFQNQPSRMIKADLSPDPGAGVWQASGLMGENAVYELRLSVANDAKINVSNKEIVFQRISTGGYEARTVAEARDGILRLTWDTGIERGTVSLRALPCHAMANTQFTKAMLADPSLDMQDPLLVSSAEECCGICYENAACESWMWIPFQVRSSCWLLKDVQGLRRQEGAAFGRIRGMMN